MGHNTLAQDRRGKADSGLDEAKGVQHRDLLLNSQKSLPAQTEHEKEKVLNRCRNLHDRYCEVARGENR